MSTSVSSFPEVFQEELHEIRKRREASGQWEKGAGGDMSEGDLKKELTGLALSGGGVRSAAFNIGLLQALYKSGRLKLIDYLSTVSGGGYAGALFSSEVAQDRDGVNWDRTTRGTGHNRLSLEAKSKTGQSPRVLGLALYGRRMSDLVKLLSRHLAGWMMTLLFLLSGTLCVAAILAWLMRKPWDEGAMSLLPQLGFSTDITRAFFPAFLALLFWMFTWIVSIVGRAFGWKSPPATRMSYVILIATTALSFFSFLAIKDVGFDSWIEDWGLSDSWKQHVNGFVRVIGGIISAIFVLIVIPFLMPKTLLRSGAQKSKPLQRLIFNISGYGVLVGVPLIVFYLLCGENISGEHDKRINDGKLARSNLRGFRDFAEMLSNEQGKAPASQVKAQLWNAVTNVPGNNGQGATTIREWIQLTDQNQGSSRDLNFGARWVDFLSDAVIRDHKFSDRLNASRTSAAALQKFAEALTTECLSNPGLFPLSRRTHDRPLADAEAVVDLIDRILSIPVRGNPRVSAGDDESGLSINGRPFDTVLQETWLVPADRLNELKKEAFQLIAYQNEVESIKLTVDNIAEAIKRLNQKQDGNDLAKAQFQQALPSEAVLRAVQPLLNRYWASLREHYERSNSDVVRRDPDTDKESGDDPGLLWVWNQIWQEPVKPEEISPKGPVAETVAPRHIEEFGGWKLSLLWKMLSEERKKIEASPEQNAEYVTWLKTMEQQVKRVLTATRRSNWVLLQARFPDNFTGQDVIYASVVNASDQERRLKIAWTSLIVFLVIGVIANMNTSCLHGVYRDQISGVWLSNPKTLLKDLDTCSHGGPLHLINCTMNHLSSPDDPDLEQRSRFVLSSRFCGTTLTGYRRTELYDEGQTTVADAIAISGAAVATATADNMLYRILLLLTNFRTGQWVRNPTRYQGEHYWPAPLRVIVSMLWNPQERPYCFLSDGGHLDNTGLASLLQRRCRFMILGDASYDPDYEFEDLRRVLQSARAKYDLAFSPLSDLCGLQNWDFLNVLRPDEYGISQEHFVVLRVQYPDKTPDGFLVIIKSSLTGDEPLDITERKRSYHDFPHDTTANQFLPPLQFESYVILGRHIGDELCDFLDQHEALIGDDFSLPEAWIAGPKGPDNPVDDAAAATETVETTTNPLLPDSPFTAENVTLACGQLNEWATTPAPDTPRAGEPALEQISMWARHEEPPMERALRTQLCGCLMELIESHLPRIIASNQAILEFSRILNTHGKGIKGVAAALLKLSRTDDLQTSSSDSSERGNETV